jgi:CheY-like chemotaxis protein
MAKVFQPYFTTKPEGHGTGLGLSVVHELVTTSGGAIDARSVPSLGTTFTVRFPLAEGRITPVSHPVIADPRDTGDHTVLLIDDEEAVRRSTRRILERTGYKVLEARSGDEGLRLLGTHRSSIAAIVTDLYMPGLSGPPLIERMRAEAPEIGCLAISGHAERFSRLKPEQSALIVQQKPCQAAVLIGHVVTLVEGTTTRRSNRNWGQTPISPAPRLA